MNQSRPATPGQILEREFLAPYGITQTDLATHTGWTRKHVNGVWGAMEPKTNVRVYHRRSVPSSHAFASTLQLHKSASRCISDSS